MQKIWLGGIFGEAVGDALGLPVQFMEREDLMEDPITGMIESDIYQTPAGTWSDKAG